MSRCKLISEGGYILLAMPDGCVIPMQTDMSISQKVEDEGKVLVTITVIADSPLINSK